MRVIRLNRNVRFAVNPGGADELGENAYAGSPPVRGLGAAYELEISCVAPIDPVAQYVIDIKDIDKAVRATVVPAIAAAVRDPAGKTAEGVLAAAMPGLNAALGGMVDRVTWKLGRFQRVTIMSKSATTVLLRQRFDFAASHRLHVDGLSAEENRRRFGKCNYESGHGHNYQFEPVVAFELASPARFTIDDLEKLAAEAILSKFDHRYLNVDCPEFDPRRGGVVPSVETMAKVFFELLGAALARSGLPATLREMTVAETDRTSATYPA